MLSFDVVKCSTSRKAACRAQAGSEAESGDNADVDGFRNRMQDMWEVEEEKDIEKKLNDAIDAAKEVCDEQPTASDCAIAWEEANELSDAQMRRQWRREDKNRAASVPDEPDVEPTPESLDRLLEQTPDIPKGLQPPRVPPGKELPRTQIVRDIMEPEDPCKTEDSCGPESGSFFKAAELERMFGGGTREHFEEMMRESNENLGRKNKNNRAPDDDEEQKA